MPLFDESTPRAKRGLVLLAGLAAAFMLLLLALAPFLAPGRDPQTAARRAPRAAGAPAPEEQAWTPPAPPPPAGVPAETAEVAAAMDLAGARGLLVSLMDAAAQGNEALEASAAAGLRRYGHRVQPLIDEQRAEASNERVRAALDRVRAAAR